MSAAIAELGHKVLEVGSKYRLLSVEAERLGVSAGKLLSYERRGEEGGLEAGQWAPPSAA